MKILVVAVCLLALTSEAKVERPHPCLEQARTSAAEILKCHRDASAGSGPNPLQIDIDDKVSVLPRISNPADKRQRLDVLEVWGHIYKGNYRIRVIYVPGVDGCPVVGHELLEWGKF